MIYIDVIGDNYGPLIDDDIVKASLFAIKELMPRKKKLDIVIELCHTGEDAEGYHWLENKYTHTHRIELNPYQSKKDFVTCLFHELVHVRQAERGIDDDDSLPYYERPNEIEAYKLQEELFKKWKKLK
jgi:hypothetical protein